MQLLAILVAFKFVSINSTWIAMAKICRRNRTQFFKKKTKTKTTAKLRNKTEANKYFFEISTAKKPFLVGLVSCEKKMYFSDLLIVLNVLIMIK